MPPAMTRWARKAAAEGGKALPATPWDEMAAPAEPARKRRRRKKEYADRDVNGFAAHLRKAAAGGEQQHEEEERGEEEEEEEAAAARKALRREGRRLRRQEARRSAMVRGAPPVLPREPARTWGQRGETRC